MAAGENGKEVLAEEELVLLDFWASPFGLRARVALAEKKLSFSYREQNLAAKGEELLAANPVHKKVPVLLHGGRAIAESLIIVQYIDEVWPQASPAPLLPADPYARARARFWGDYVDKKIGVCGQKLWRTTGEAQAEAKKEFFEVMRVLEGELGEKPFFGGETFGFVDIALISFTCWFRAYEVFAKFSVEEELPKIAAWAKRCGERESVAATLPSRDKVYELTVGLRKRYGIE